MLYDEVDGDTEDTVDAVEGPADGGRSLEMLADGDGSAVAGAVTLSVRGRGWPKTFDSGPSLAPLHFSACRPTVSLR